MTQVRALAVREEGGQVVEVFAAGNYQYAKPEFGGQLGGLGQVWRFRPGAPAAIRDLRPTLTGEVRALAFVGDDLLAARNGDAVVRLTPKPPR